MSTLPESQLISLVKDNKDSGALIALADMHSGIYFTKVHQYAHVYPDIIKVDDLRDDKLFNIYRFILDYKDDRDMKLGTYIGQRTDYLCKTLLRKDDRPPQMKFNNLMGDSQNMRVDCSQDSLVDESLLGSPEIGADKDIVIEDIIKMANAPEVCPDKRFATILDLRGQSLTWREIGKRMKISHEYARKIFNANMMKIKNRINKGDTL